MAFVLLLITVWADTGRRAEPRLTIEKLGRSWTAGQTSVDGDLAIQRFQNLELRREEIWHQASDGKWFLQVRERLYVLGVQCPDGSWETRPTERIVHRGGTWKRIQVR